MNSSSKVLDFVRKYTMIIALILVVVFFSVATNGTLIRPSNVNNVIAQNAYVFVLATGMLLCILTGGNIDLSVGSVVCFVGAVGAVLMVNQGWHPVLAVLTMFVVGTLIGAWQAFWIAYVRIPPFIVTLSGMLIFRGLSNVILKNGMTISVSKYTGFVKAFGGGADCYIPDFVSETLVLGQLAHITCIVVTTLVIAAFLVIAVILSEKKNRKNGVESSFKKWIIKVAPVVVALVVIGFVAARFVPDPLSKYALNFTCLFATAIAIAVFVAMNISNRNKRLRKQYEVEKFTPWLVKLIAISVAVAAFGYRLSEHKGIPNVLLIVLAVVIIYSYITSNTRIGRYFYAVGGNEKATKLSGINTNKVYFLAYTNMGLLAALAGMIATARLTTATAQAGQNYEMDANASCFIGGASAYGGIGTVPGVIIGALLMGVINLGMNTMHVDQNMQQVVKGLVLLAAVIFDVVSKRGGKLIAKNT